MNISNCYILLGRNNVINTSTTNQINILFLLQVTTATKYMFLFFFFCKTTTTSYITVFYFSRTKMFCTTAGGYIP